MMKAMLEEVEEEGEEKDQERYEDQKPGLPARHRHEQVFDQTCPFTP